MANPALLGYLGRVASCYLREKSEKRIWCSFCLQKITLPTLFNFARVRAAHQSHVLYYVIAMLPSFTYSYYKNSEEIKLILRPKSRLFWGYNLQIFYGWQQNLKLKEEIIDLWVLSNKKYFHLKGPTECQIKFHYQIHI